MKKAIWISTFREIRQSFGRFFAIMAIIALGVAFYAGLTITKSAMVRTAGEYLEEQEFYDYRILSTMGFQQEEVDFLLEKEDVKAAEGAVSFDIICSDEKDNDIVLKAHSITEHINKVKLLEGRLPENPNECVVDSEYFEKTAIGERIRFSENNDTDDLEQFVYDEYTIVGIVQSPYYIQFERGNTSLGSGRLSGFIYLPYEGFDVDYFTEIFVTFRGDYPLYSEEYESFLEGKKVIWEEYAAESANMRYTDLMDEANQELADAKEKFETEKADAEADLKEAGDKLADAEAQLADGEAQLADAEKELKEAKDTLVQKEKELKDAEREIANQEAELLDGEQKLSDGISEWQDKNTEVDEAAADLKNQLAGLAEQKTALEAQEANLLAGETALLEQEADLLRQNQAMPGQPLIEAGLSEIATKKAELEAGKKQIAEGKAAIAGYEQQINAGLEQINAGNRQLADAWVEIEANRQQLENGKKALADAKAEIADGKEQIAAAKKELAEGEQKLLEKEQEFADAKTEYEDGLEEYEEGLAEFHERIADAEQEIADAEKDIAELEEPDSYLLGRDTNVGYVCFENDSSIIEGIAKVFPVFFFLVAALVCVTTMNRMVEEQRTQIGVLKALGYGEGVIMGKYLFYSGAAAIIGCIVGYFGGTYLFPEVIWYAYGVMYRVDDLIHVFNGELALISLVVSALCSMGATWLSCRVELKEVAAQLMRPKTPKAGKRVFLEYLPFVWKHLSFLKKVSIRNIFRYKKRLFMMVLGISGCTALLVTGYGVKDSIANVATQQFEEISIYDINIVLSEEFRDEDAALIEAAVGTGAEQLAPVYETGYDLVAEQGRKAVNIVVFDSETDMTPFLNLHTEENETIPFPGYGEAVITDKLAKEHDIEIGDRVTLQNEEMQTFTATISGINQNFIYNYIYVSRETYEQQTGTEAEFKNVYLNVNEDADLHLIAAALMKEDNIASVTLNRDTMERLNSMLSCMDLIVLVIIFCAGGLAFIVLYNLTNINITERIREIATIKVLGFRKKETAAYVFRENLVLSGMGIAVGLVLGRCLHLFVMSQVKIDMIAFSSHIRPVSYLYSVLLTFAFTWLVNRFMRGKLERVSMTESLKSVD